MISRTATLLAPDLRFEARWLSCGFLLMFWSSFGQTFVIALFAGHLKTDLSLSDGQFGSLYAAGTLASACILIWAGKLADHLPIRWLAAGVLGGLALTCLAMASVTSAWMLGLVLFGLRFFGQGMTTHVAMTAMGRWFNRKRGQGRRHRDARVSGRRGGGAAGRGDGDRPDLPIPVLIILLKRERTPTAGRATDVEPTRQPPRREWTRGEVLRSPLFYALLPGLLAQAFIQTGIFFNQVTIVESKGWELSWFAASFPLLAAVGVVTALASGWLVDRFGARRLLPAFLVPLGLATLLLTYATSPYALPVIVVLIGITGGSCGTIQGGPSSMGPAIWVRSARSPRRRRCSPPPCRRG